MKKMAFVTRHAPTEGQIKLAAKAGFELIGVGDCDAFTGQLPQGFDAVAVVHAAAALRLLNGADGQVGAVVAVFENGNRAPEGAKPQFEAVALHVYSVQVGGDALAVRCQKFE
jgi:hypothetical protein